MSTPRLTFLYPHLFRTIRASETAALRRATTARKPRARCCQYAATITTETTPRQQIAKRHGKAVEPLPLYTETDTPLSPSVPDATAGVKGVAGKAGETGTAPQAASPGTENEPKIIVGSAQDKLGELGNELFQMPPPPSPPPSKVPGDTERSEGTDTDKPPPNTGPLQTILHMAPPTEGLQDITGSPTRPPHLTPPPYVHHFDSYSLVKQLQDGGWTDAQAITAMKAVRGLLAVNLDVAQAGLVSKSDVENETYLFRAACSELSVEVKKNRRVADEHMRQQRTTLQHEVDILTQSLNQEVLTLNDSVKGMFNDRRMAVREEQKAAESSIQQINYKISVMLNSDARSEIEGLRWVLIRRSVTGILFMVVLIFGSLRYASYLSHERKKEAEKAAKEAEALRREAGRNDHSSAPDAAEILTAM